MPAFDAIGLDAIGLAGVSATGTTNPGTPGTTDTTAPTLAGTLAVTSITTTGARMTWPAASDNVGVSGYEISCDTGTPAWADKGNVLTATVAGLDPATNYTARVRAYDAAGNRSAALTAALRTAIPTTPPPLGAIDAGMVPATRTVIFEGSLRVVTFEG